MKALSMMIAFMVMGCSARITPLETLIRDQQAARLVKKEQTEAALHQYIQILENSPNEPEVHSNIGILLNQSEKPEDALKSLQLGLRLAELHQDLSAQFAIRYNLGTYYGALKKISEALDNYQAALEIVPTSKETKTNIELLIKSQQQDQQKKDGDKGESKPNEDNKKQNDGQDKKNDPKDGDDKKQDDSQKGEPPKPKNYEQSSKYKPRPFQGDQLSEGDVKKILGELRNQEQKIRANFDKKERKESKNEKDW